MGAQVKPRSIYLISCRAEARRVLTEEKVILCIFFCLCAFLCKVGRASAQDTPEVHIVARSLKTDSSSVPSASNLIFKSSADLVLVNAMVTDSLDRLVTGLDKSNFAIYQDKRLQTISSLSKDDAPVSIGVILDASGSMRDKMRRQPMPSRPFWRPLIWRMSFRSSVFRTNLGLFPRSRVTRPI
jgi:hypothetical protein